MFDHAELASAMCSGCWNCVTSLFKKEQGQFELLFCIPIPVPVFFPPVLDWIKNMQ